MGKGAHTFSSGRWCWSNTRPPGKHNNSNANSTTSQQRRASTSGAPSANCFNSSPSYTNYSTTHNSFSKTRKHRCGPTLASTLSLLKQLVTTRTSATTTSFSRCGTPISSPVLHSHQLRTAVNVVNALLERLGRASASGDSSSACATALGEGLPDS